MRRLTRSDLRRSGRRLLGAPRLTVVVWVPEGASFVDECLASVRASERVVAEVVRVAEGRPVEEAIEAATGEYVAFLSADDVVRPEGMGVLAAALAGGADIAVGGRECRRAGKLMPLPPAGAPTDLSLTGKLFRLSSWRAAGITVGVWEGQARAVAAARGALPDVVVVPELVCVEHDRDLNAPVQEQRRFRVDLAQTRFAALRDVLPATTDPAGPGWRADSLHHLLPGLCRDAVGGGPEHFAALQPFARDVVDDLPPPKVVPVEARMVAWVAARGSLADVALTLDHLADNPHGLPVTERLAHQPAGLSVTIPAEWRSIGPGDRTLRSRVLDLQPQGRHRVRLAGNAFTAHAAGHVPGVQVVGSGETLEVPVVRRHDAGANDWAARAWEDRGDSGFEADIAAAALPPSKDGTWVVVVSLDSSVTEHRVRLLPAEPTAAPTIDQVDLDHEGLRLRGTGAPGRLRLSGPKGSTPWADAPLVGDRFDATLTLVTTSFAGQTLPPGGWYAVEAQGARGRAVPASWSTALLAEPPDLVAERLGVRLAHDGPVGALVVGPPLSAHDRSAFAQQQRITAYAAAPRAEAPRTVLLESFHGRVVADNPAAIGRELAARSDLGDLDLAWVVDDPAVVVPEGSRAVPRRTQGWYDALAGAHAHVSNAAAPPWFHKADGQFHLQTWHGTPLKKIGEDRGPGDFNTWRHRRHVAGQAARWDAMISPSPYCSEIFRSAFRYDGPMLEIGYPRNDVLLSDRAPLVRAETRRRLGLTDADRVLLYAPTWREYVGVRDSKPLFLDPAEVVAAMPDVVVLIRGHYNASRQPDAFTDQPRIVDVTRYPDIADLYLAADSLVTDYSSVMFDFALTDKPMVLLTPDLDQYRDVERGFYFDIESEPPGPMVDTTDGVLASLVDPDRYAGARARFRERFCPFDDGNASARACDHLLGAHRALP